MNHIDGMYGGAEEWESGEESWAGERHWPWRSPAYEPPYGLPRPRIDVWGYKDSVSGHRYDPRYNGPCAICGQPLNTAPIETLYTMHVVREGDRREWFCRLHPACRDPVLEMQIEASIGARAR